MKKKLMSLVLLAGLLLSAVTGCSSSTDTESAAEQAAKSAKTATITLTAITGSSTTEEAIKDVQAALNKITKSELKTQVILQLTTADKYVDFVDSQVAKIEEEIAAAEEEEARIKEEKKAKKEAEKLANAGKKNRSKWTTTTTAETEEDTGDTQEMTQDEFGREIMKYPDLEGTSLDILFISGIDMYNDFVEKEYLTSLNDELANGSKILNKYIYPTILNAGRENSSTSTCYAIVNNHMIGEYTYLLVDKTLAKKYSFDASKVKTLADCEEFLDNVKANEPDYVPLNKSVDLNYVYYCEGERSMVGTIIKPTYLPTSKAMPKNLLLDSSYQAHYALLDKLKAGNYIGTGSKYAIEIVNGYIDAPEVNGWEDNYEVVVYEKPVATNDNVFNGMFAVSAYASDVARCMEVVTLLNTNAEYRNTYAFGVEGVNYEFNEDGTVHMLNNDWSMDFFHTGNTYIGAVPETLPANYAEIGKLQNIETIISPFLKWVYANEETAATSSAFAAIDKKYLAAFDAASTEEKLTYKDLHEEEFKADEALENMVSADGKDGYAVSYVDFQQSTYPAS